jgi:hypothetical protein
VTNHGLFSGDQQQQGATPDLQNMTDEELALYLSNNQDFL